ncbi:hypothetical protein [Mycobacterium heidelbergense]|nr:hypothetical protein [Mycobacterium heidelbergense]
MFFRGGKMSGHRRIGLFVAAAAGLCGLVGLAPTASASGASAWNGQYLLTFSANQKTGTSAVARQPEYAQRASYSFTSSCSTGVCVATVANPPAPKNQYMPRSVQYTWNGSQWVQQTSGNFDCLLVNGAVEHDPAKSVTVYTPAANGALTGVSRTVILSGACRGNVDMPVSATPVQPEVV